MYLYVHIWAAYRPILCVYYIYIYYALPSQAKSSSQFYLIVFYFYIRIFTKRTNNYFPHCVISLSTPSINVVDYLYTLIYTLCKCTFSRPKRRWMTPWLHFISIKKKKPHIYVCVYTYIRLCIYTRPRKLYMNIYIYIYIVKMYTSTKQKTSVCLNRN